MGRVKYKGKIYKSEYEFLHDVAGEIGTTYATAKTLLWREKKALKDGITKSTLKEYTMYRKAVSASIKLSNMSNVYTAKNLEKKKEKLRALTLKITEGRFDNSYDASKEWGTKNYMDRALTRKLSAPFYLLD